MTNEASAPPPPSQHREPIEADREAIITHGVRMGARYLMQAANAGRLSEEEIVRVIMDRLSHFNLSTPAASDAEGYEFDRYVNGVLMAEGVAIERERTLEAACRVAARIASRGPNGEAPVLVLRALPLPKAGEGEA